jgi:MSHA biogenesis protein MshP
MMSQRVVQRGFAAIAAIFLVLILAALGAFMVSFSNTQQLNSAQDVQGSRAYWAARAGLEWGLFGVNSASACPAAAITLTIEGFSVEIKCTSQTFAEAAATPKLFWVTAKAWVGSVGSTGFIERSVSASMEK